LQAVSARAIHHDIVATPEPNLAAYSTITRLLCGVEFLLSTEEASDADDREPIDDADEVILSTVNENRLAPM
jgi:hypothetical protein